MGGESALGEPTGPKGLVTGAQLAPDVQPAVMGLPKLLLAGLLSNNAGELVCSLWFQDAAPCRVSPSMTGRPMRSRLP